MRTLSAQLEHLRVAHGRNERTQMHNVATACTNNSMGVAALRYSRVCIDLSEMVEAA